LKNKKKIDGSVYNIAHYQNKNGGFVMNNYFFKLELEDLSQGAILKFTKDLRYMSKEKVAKLLNLGGENPTETLGK